MSRTSLLSLTVMLAALCAAVPTAQAQTPFTNEAAFNAAATTTQTFGFENIAPSGSFATNPNLVPLTVSVEGGSDPNVRVFDSVGESDRFSINGTDSLVAGAVGGFSPPTVTIQFGSKVSAFGTQIRLVNLFGGTAQTNFVFAQLFDGSTPVGNSFFANPFPTGFLGVVSGNSFDRISLTTGNNNGAPYQVFDNVRVRAFAVVPEAGAATLFLTTLPCVGLVALRRKRRNG